MADGNDERSWRVLIGGACLMLVGLLVAIALIAALIEKVQK